MNTIVSILDDFFYCSRQPIQAIDSNFNIIYKKGVAEEFENKFNIIEMIKSSKDINPFSTVSINNDYSFLIVPISKFDSNKGYYIVGPFKQTTCTEENNYNLYCINNRCIKYLYNLLTDISNDKFSKGRNSLNYNPYIKKAVEYCIKNYESNLDKDFKHIFYNAQLGFTFQMQLLFAPINLSDTEEMINKKLDLVSKYIDMYIYSRVINYRSCDYNTVKNRVFRINS